MQYRTRHLVQRQRPERQNHCGVTQNRDGKQVVLAPKAAANAKPEWPMTSYLSRG